MRPHANFSFYFPFYFPRFIFPASLSVDTSNRLPVGSSVRVSVCRYVSDALVRNREKQEKTGEKDVFKEMN